MSELFPWTAKVADELAVQHLASGRVRETHIDHAHGLLLATSIRPGHPSYSQRISGPRAPPRAERHGLGGFLAHRAEFRDGFFRHAQPLHLHAVGVSDEAA